MRIAVEYPELLRKSVAVLRKWRASFPKSVWAARHQIRPRREGVERVRARDRSRRKTRGGDGRPRGRDEARERHRPVLGVRVPRHVSQRAAGPEKSEADRAAGQAMADARRRPGAAPDQLGPRVRDTRGVDYGRTFGYVRMDAGLARPSAHAQDGPEASGTAAADGNARVPEVPGAVPRARRALVRHALGEGGGDVQRARHRVHAVPQAVLPARVEPHVHARRLGVPQNARRRRSASRVSRVIGRRVEGRRDAERRREVVARDSHDGSVRAREMEE